ncbi:hypothetical protein BS47DRAFT_1369572 [Hydnum rufescens UP504]|uniref:Uncharacterized protein n=1 Tax=Hydnum rufescens UP504 TaxID=1448309 RepID=A0A9P6DLT2_9AGAM|nr:hypothetical protein BS47DRAFT_1369572 [Hydnum rufescens UP504]
MACCPASLRFSKSQFQPIFGQFLAISANSGPEEDIRKYKDKPVVRGNSGNPERPKLRPLDFAPGLLIQDSYTTRGVIIKGEGGYKGGGNRNRGVARNKDSHHILKITTASPKCKAFDDPSEEPSSSGAQESSKINVMSQELSYPQINIGRHKVDDEANDKVNDKTANMEKSGLPGGNQRNKKFHVIASTPSQPPKNWAYIQLESHPKIPKVEYQHKSQRSASLLNGTPTSSQVDYPDDPPLLPIQSSEPERASSTFGYNEEPTVLLSGSSLGSHFQDLRKGQKCGTIWA